MPPKAKKGKKGKKLPVLIDGVDTSSMTRDQLEAFALRLKAEMDREREERNYFQLERDKIRTFWDITRTQLEETRIELRQKDKDIELTQDMADVETKQILQQMKYLQFENHSKIGEVRAEAVTQLKLAQENHMLQELELLTDKRELRRLMRESSEMRDMQLRELERRYNEQLLQERMAYEKERKDTLMLHEVRMKDQKDKLTLFYRSQMFEVEERKNKQIRSLQDHHDVAFDNMKNYYNDITLNNLALIGSLKEQLETLRKNSERSDRLASEAQAETRRLREPLEATLLKVNELRRKLEFYDRDKQQLMRLKARTNFLEKRCKSLTWETEALILRNDSLVREREEIKARFGDVVVELQQKTGLKNVLLERKVLALLKAEEKRKIVLTETLKCCAPALKEKIAGIENQIEDALNEKSAVIADLRLELARAQKAHDDLLATFECKLERLGMQTEELGFEVIRKQENEDALLPGPAGLVTKNK